MKKRLTCLLLSVVMLLACLVGCAQKTDEEAIDDVNEQASESALTLVMYLLAEQDVTPEQEAKIEAAVNKITKAKFKAQLDLKFFTEDAYYDALETSFAARLEAEAAGLIGDDEEENAAPKEDETFENDYGMVEIKYPTVAGYQVDIFYLGGYQKFSEYNDMGMLQNINEELNSSSKIIKEYISSDLLDGAKAAQNGVYALPTNTAIGEYTYLLINKEALSELSYYTDAGLDKFTSFTGADTQKFLSDISKYFGSKYVPLYSNLSNTQLASIQGIKYWGVDEDGELCDDFSVIGSNYAIGSKFGTEESYMPTVNNLFTTTTFYSNYLDVVMNYRQNGYFGTEQDMKDGKVAMACLKGSPELAYRYSEDYVAVPISAPVLKTEDLYNDMFAVSSYTSSVSRSMKVLTYLNTNEEFRNIILYGIEGENYKFVESDYKDAEGNPYMVVERNGSYMMDVNKTGNTFLAYPQVGDNPALMEFAKEQNRNVSTSITMGFRLDYDDNRVNPTQLQQIRALSAEVCKLFDECTAETYLSAKLKVNSLLTNKANATLIDSLCSTLEPTEGGEAGIAFVYTQWAIANGLYVPEVEE